MTPARVGRGRRRILAQLFMPALLSFPNQNRARRQRGPAAVPMADRTLPHSLEAEAGLIAAVCVEPGLLDTLHAQGVTAAVFYTQAAADAWAAAWSLVGRGSAIDAGVMYAELQRMGRADAARWLVEVTAQMPSAAQAAHHAREVVGLALRRSIIRLAAEVSQKILALTSDRTGLPGMLRDAEFEAMALPVPPMLIDKVMHQGRRTLLVAPSKASKTFTALDMTCAVSTGTPWLGFRTNRVPVLHIDLELPTWGLKQRREALRAARGITGPMDVDWWSLDGYQRSIDELLPLIAARAPLGKFGMIVIEPAYVIMGRRDENDNADVTDFMNQLAWLTRLTGAAVLCTHHMGKGAPGDKQVKDRASGAGAWVRAPDTAITLTPLAEEQGEDVYSMEFIERNMKRHAPLGVRFEYPVFKLQSGLDLNAVRESGRPKVSTESDVVRLLEGQPALSHGQLLKLAEKRGMSERTFNRRLKEAEEAGKVIKTMGGYQLRGDEVGAGN
jgi:hypothetical protein